MNTQRSRADDQLDAWARATARPAPAFNVRQERRPWARAFALVAIAAALMVGLLAGALAVGLVRDGPKERDPRDLAASIDEAIARAPGVGYAVTIATRFDDATLRTNSAGEIDFEGKRFAGTADGGGGGAMIGMFGGPSRGAMVHIGGDLFIQTEGGPWERVPDLSTFPAVVADRARLSSAIEAAITASQVDPTVRFRQCGAEACQVVGVSLPAEALSGLEALLIGDNASPLPSDLRPVVVDLYFDPTGFPVRMETQITAGTTVTTVMLQLARLDPAPSIAPPIP